MSEVVDFAIPSLRPAVPWRLFSVEAMTAAGTNLLVSAIYFYTIDRFHWGLRQNLLLATGQGVFYVVGALGAGAFTRRVGQYRGAAIVFGAMGALSLLAALASANAVIVTALLLAYSFCSAVGWPIMESLVSTGVNSHFLSRRISIYNIVWSAVSVVMLGVDGLLIVHWSAGVFLVPAVAHGISALLMLRGALKRRAVEPPGQAVAHAPSAEPQLLRVRTLALWLSRSVLPATYVVIFSLMALMPSLPIMQHLSEEVKTPISSIWMAARCVAFALLGFGAWWHTRPRVLLLAALVVLATYFGVTIRPSDLFGNVPPFVDLLLMIASQIALGLALGMIYAASLYFGMVLSDGSTEHGGYHEALIGAGFILGPGAGSIAQSLFPASAVYGGIMAVGAVVFVSVAAVMVIAMAAGKKPSADVR